MDFNFFNSPKILDNNIITFSSFLKESLPRLSGEYPEGGGGWLNY
jgi:hypothetical protein